MHGQRVLGFVFGASLTLMANGCASPPASTDLGADTQSEVSPSREASIDVVFDAALAPEVSVDLQAPTDIVTPPDTASDLSTADMSTADLSTADMSAADMSAADMSAPDAVSDVLSDAPRALRVGCVGSGCGAGERCNEWTGRCQPSALPYPPPGGDNGEACGMGADCRSAGVILGASFQSCAALTGASASGRCVSYCSLVPGLLEADRLVRNDCPAGSVCHPDGPGSAQIGQGSFGVCVRECQTDSDCNQTLGDFCRHNLGGRSFLNGYCAPTHCRSRPCTLTLQCSC